MIPIIIFWFANQFLNLYTSALIGVGFISSIIPLHKSFIAPVTILLGDFIGACFGWNFSIIWQIIQRSLSLPEPPDNLGTFLGYIMLIAGFGIAGIAGSAFLLISPYPKKRVNLTLSITALTLVVLSNILLPIANNTVPIK